MNSVATNAPYQRWYILHQSILLCGCRGTGAKFKNILHLLRVCPRSRRVHISHGFSRGAFTTTNITEHR